MKNQIAFLLLIINCPFSLAQKAIEGPPPKNTITYYCSPCGCSEDDKYFSSSGVCSSCHMELQPTLLGLERVNRSTPTPTVGIFLFNMADIMDVSGPLSVFEHAGFNVSTFAKTKESVRIGMNIELTPDYSIESLPPVDVLVLPGGGMAESNPEDQTIVNFLKSRKDATKVLFSVCSGAFFLGEAGLLDNKQSTTFAGLIPRLAEQYPKSLVLNNVKYADNGQVVTSAGLSSGIDASFHVVSKFYGIGRAQEIANHMEYPWKREHDYARSQLAINYIGIIQRLTQIFSKDYFYSEGDQNQWECRFKLTRQLSSVQIKKLIEKEIEKQDGWTMKSSGNQYFTGTMNHPILGTGEISFSITSGAEPIATIKAQRLDKVSF